MTESKGRGRFIVLEGIDGSGKSTQSALLSQRLRKCGVAVHVTAEPTAGPIGTLIRQGFNGRVDLDDRAIAALFVADRVDHLTNQYDGILRLLADGVTVISDRYYLSSLAYHASDVATAWITSANSLATDLLLPDLTIYIALEPEVALSRLNSGRTSRDKFEVIARLQDASDNYDRAIESATETIVRVLGGATEAELSDDIWSQVELLFPFKSGR